VQILLKISGKTTLKTHQTTIFAQFLMCDLPHVAVSMCTNYSCYFTFTLTVLLMQKLAAYAHWLFVLKSASVNKHLPQ